MKTLILLFIVLIAFFYPMRNFAQPLLENATADQVLNMVEQFKGEKVVILNFWATWCAPCVEEFPELIQIQKKHNSDVELIFVSADFEDSRNDAIEFLDRQGVFFKSFFKIGADDQFISTISKNWTGALPFTVIFDKEGNRIKEWEEKTTFSTLDEELHKLLKE